MGTQINVVKGIKKTKIVRYLGKLRTTETNEKISNLIGYLEGDIIEREKIREWYSGKYFAINSSVIIIF